MKTATATATATATHANQYGYSDVTPFEVTRHCTEKKLEIRKMIATRAEPAQQLEWVTGGFAGHCVNQHAQRWTITSDDAGDAVMIRLHKNGNWRDKHGNQYVLATEPIRFYDFNF